MGGVVKGVHNHIYSEKERWGLVNSLMGWFVSICETSQLPSPPTSLNLQSLLFYFVKMFNFWGVIENVDKYTMLLWQKIQPTLLEVCQYLAKNSKFVITCLEKVTKYKILQDWHINLWSTDYTQLGISQKKKKE